MTAKTAAERKAEERARKRGAGLKLLQVWVHPDDEADVSRYASRRLKHRNVEAVAGNLPVRG